MKVKNQSAISLRPKRFSELVGQDKIVRKLRNLVKDRMPKAFLFYGPKGGGKTTTARILAISLQCNHQKEFGEPCDRCLRRYRKGEYTIIEINCASVVERTKEAHRTSAAQAIRDKLSATAYELLQGKFRVYIFDEAHDLSPDAQDVLLKYFEDSPEENIFIINSTRPEKIVDTLRSRCMVMHIRPLKYDDIKILVKRGLKHCGSDLSSTSLTDELAENKIDSPRLILNAVENYVAGDSPEDAAQVEGATEVDAKSLCRHVVKGDWPGIAKMLRGASATEARRLRAAVIGYLREILFDCSELDDRTKAVYESIKILSSTSWTEDANQIALLSAELAMVCGVFKNYNF
jgi:DNA polymerase III subunit gamma/tau